LSCRWLVAVITLIGVGVATAAAGPFSDLIVFGDSLSDVGNVAQASFDIYPGRYYYNDRFSNGPVWVESLSLELGLGSLQRSTAGGANFAYGGAQTTGTGGLEGLFIRDIDEQVTQFLTTRAVDAGALFVVFAGSNDLIGGESNIAAPVDSLAKDIRRLIAAGARQFLMPNLPLLGFTPRYNDSAPLAAQYRLRTEQFNAALDLALDNLADSNAEVTFHRLDVAGLFASAIAEPAAFGLANVTDSAAPGLEPGTASYNSSQIVPNPNEYMFWDDLHPTAAVHAILAGRAEALLMGIPGDFDANGLVNAADLAAWRIGFGARGDVTRAQGDADGDQDVDGEDFLTWQRQLGNRGMQSVAFVTSVPEPGTAGLALGVSVATLLRHCLTLRRRRTSRGASARIRRPREAAR
jgi:phospholipase/lecithinase/hemolysin